MSALGGGLTTLRTFRDTPPQWETLYKSMLPIQWGVAKTLYQWVYNVKGTLVITFTIYCCLGRGQTVLFISSDPDRICTQLQDVSYCVCLKDALRHLQWSLDSRQPLRRFLYLHSPNDTCVLPGDQCVIAAESKAEVRSEKSLLHFMSPDKKQNTLGFQAW